MQVAGHVLWPRAAWLYHGATLLMTLSFLVSGGLVSKLTLGRGVWKTKTPKTKT